MLLKSGSALLTDGYSKTSLQALQSKLEARIRALQANVDANMATAQQRYKRDYARQVGVTTTFHHCDWVFIDRPPFVVTLHTDAARTALST